MINTFRLAKLPNPIYVQFMDYVATLVTDKDPVELNVKPQHDLLLQKLAELKSLYKSVQASSFSEKIIEADGWRDQILIGIITLVEANSFHFKEDRRVAAQILQKNIRIYGDRIAKNDYQTETAKLENLTNDWHTKPELQHAVDLLEMGEWIAVLANANNEFKRLYASRTDEYSQRTDQNMQSKRVEVNAAYEDLCKFLNSYAVINSSEAAYEAVASGINAYVDQYATLVKQKKIHKTEKPKVK
jgi:hypothetical protein